jgi:NitT/TauT family transport system substrate-binding protein
MTLRRLVSLVALACLLSARTSVAAEPERVRVIVPDADNLQYLAFWVARGAGFFDEERLALDLSIPAKPVLAQSLFQGGDAEVAVLSPPMYLRLVAENFPVLLVANLLQNDPINLIVRRSVAEARKIAIDQPLDERLAKLKGLRIGVAPGPPTRLRALFAAHRLDADKQLTLVTLHGSEQNEAFGAHKVDALYAHTPYMETALVDQDAVVVVNQSQGEVPELAARQIHALVVTRAFAERHASIVAAMTRAILRAERLVHADHAATVDAVLRALPVYDRGHVEKLVELYDPAVPPTPRVSADGFARALALYPASGTAPDFSAIDPSRFVAPQFAEAALAPPAARASSPRAWLTLFVLGGVAFALLFAMREAWISGRRKPARASRA